MLKLIFQTVKFETADLICVVLCELCGLQSTKRHVPHTMSLETEPQNVKELTWTSFFVGKKWMQKVKLNVGNIYLLFFKIYNTRDILLLWGAVEAPTIARRFRTAPGEAKRKLCSLCLLMLLFLLLFLLCMTLLHCLYLYYYNCCCCCCCCPKLSYLQPACYLLLTCWLTGWFSKQRRSFCRLEKRCRLMLTLLWCSQPDRPGPARCQRVFSQAPKSLDSKKDGMPHIAFLFF